jgi:hypothetical protein
MDKRPLDFLHSPLSNFLKINPDFMDPSLLSRILDQQNDQADLTHS